MLYYHMFLHFSATVTLKNENENEKIATFLNEAQKISLKNNHLNLTRARTTTTTRVRFQLFLKFNVMQAHIHVDM
jgi:hypothetical protein